jgi:hypothetical protein
MKTSGIPRIGKIFYARSSHRETTTIVFDSICEYFLISKDINIDLLDVKIPLNGIF